ncbi:hypothetical protein OUZ56_004928 [Daphnia magna]|uniref:Uncharacterized protein n=1 Tax=Daphnia magna TaxID=35525 RepID=A0ABQ9YRI2_9CRUS|nr:hypothetical protein OUZ56_004928 [Daphnia magna]
MAKRQNAHAPSSAAGRFRGDILIYCTGGGEENGRRREREKNYRTHHPHWLLRARRLRANGTCTRTRCKRGIDEDVVLVKVAVCEPDDEMIIDH